LFDKFPPFKLLILGWRHLDSEGQKNNINILIDISEAISKGINKDA